MPRYLMEDPVEAERLEIKTQRKNILKELAYLPLRPGLRVLEVGCGTGAVTRILAEKVFPATAIGMDFSSERLAVGKGILAEEGSRKVRFICSDVLSCGLKSRQFDIVYSRCTFQYLPGDPGREALAEMKSLAKPGGRVVVADVDGVCLYRFPFDPVREKALEELLKALEPKGFDAFVGRKLYGMFYEAGFKDIQVNLLPYYLIAGKSDPNTIRVWEMKIQILGKHLERTYGSRQDAKGLTDRFLKDFSDEQVLLYNLMFIVQGVA